MPSGTCTASRGHLIEPHTNELVPLGTREVDAYKVPLWLYDKILFIEKKGFDDILQKSGIAAKYDVAILSSQGYAVDAAKMLMSKAKRNAPMTFLCLHDADPHGYNIARRVGHATRRSGRIQVIDIGLKLQDAVEMDLMVEQFVRKKALPRALKLNALEREYFGGTSSWEGQVCRRVELNALAADPDRFIAYLERKLREHDCASKLVPPKRVLDEQAKKDRDDVLADSIREQVDAVLEIDALVETLRDRFAAEIGVGDIAEVIERWAKDVPPGRWRDCVRREINRRAAELAEEIQEVVLGQLRRQLSEPGRE